MKNVISKLKAPINHYKQEELRDKYSLCISEPGLRQKIDNYKYSRNDTHQPMFVLSSKRYSTQNHNLPLLGGPRDTKANSFIQHQDELLPKNCWNLHSHSKNQKSLETKRNEINDTKSLRNRANQFIKKVNEQKSKLKGRLFFLKQQQLERKKIKQQIESLEKTYMKFHYQTKRRKQAQTHIQQLAQKAKKRQKISTLKSRFRQSSLLQNVQHKKKSSIVMNKEDQHYDSRTNKAESRNRALKTQPDHQEVSNYSLNQQDANDIQQVRKKLILLNSLMKKEDDLKQKQTHIY